MVHSANESSTSGAATRQQGPAIHLIDDSHREAAAGVGSVQLHLQRFVFRVIARVGPEGAARIGCYGENFGALVVLEREG